VDQQAQAHNTVYMWMASLGYGYSNIIDNAISFTYNPTSRFAVRRVGEEVC
jgi:hypothetical protein